jgi:N-acetylglucosamine-6-phosphate deacetylase
MASVLAREGVGIFLPTTVSEEDVIEDLGEALHTVEEERGLTGRIPGLYVEGPFVSHAKRGGIPERCIKPVSLKLLDSLFQASRKTIRVMTFAPELPGSSGLCGGLRERGILPALGHSDARMADLESFEDGGHFAVTHLFNGMSGVSHRDPGLALWALLHPEAYTELICDGTHVHPAAIAMALRMRPHERIVLISDGVALAGLPDAPGGQAALTAGTRRVSMYGRAVEARGGGVYFEESGVLVGSRLLVRDGVSRLVGQLHVPVPDAVAMASLAPARLLGYQGKGALLPGWDADAAVFSGDFARCIATVFEGRLLHGLPEDPRARTVAAR